MSKLVKCKSCSKEVDSTAKVCPGCGVKNPGINTAKGCLVIVVIAITIAIFSAINDATKTPEDIEKERVERVNNECNSSISAQVTANSFVKRMLKSPSTADFPLAPEYIKKVGECTYIVKSYVDSQNSFGAVIRTPTLIKIRFDKSTENWLLVTE